LKTKRILVVQVGDDADDIDVLYEADLVAAGKDPEAAKASFGERAEWFSLHLKPATAAREREIVEKTLEGDPTAGFRSNPLLLAGARVEVMLEGWSAASPPSAAAQGNLHPNLATAVDILIQVHLRPSIRMNPDFLALLSASGTPSAPETANSSE
jgi:hypothetical protein